MRSHRVSKYVFFLVFCTPDLLEQVQTSTTTRWLTAVLSIALAISPSTQLFIICLDTYSAVFIYSVGMVSVVGALHE